MHIIYRNKNLNPKFLFILLLNIFSFSIFCSSVEIPLDKNTAVINGSENTNSSNIGYVDIERIFSEHPMKNRKIQEFNTEIEKRKKEITDIELEIINIEEIIISSSTIIKSIQGEMAVLASTPTVIEPPKTLLPGTTEAIVITQNINQSSAAMPIETVKTSTSSILNIESGQKEITKIENAIVEMKKNIAQKKDDILRKLEENKSYLMKLEEQQTSEVLSDIYILLEKIAKDENVTIILDKNNVLYGPTAQDLTNKILERLQGR